MRKGGLPKFFLSNARWLAGTVLATGWLASPVAAQAVDSGATSTSQAEAAAPEGEGLGEIIVTARRTAENLQKVPIAVTVLSSEAIRSQALVSPADLNSRVPSLSVGTSNSNRDSANYSIRGQGQAFGGSQPAVITYFAEVPTNVVGPGLLFDLQNIQVLKGPQGTLFGRNTTGGAVLLEPKRPSNELGGYVDVSVGNYDYKRLQAAFNLPIPGEKMLLRFAADINRRDGFTKDVVTGVDYDDRRYEAYRVGLIVRPFEGFENYTVVNYAKSDTNGSGSVLLGVNPNAASSFVFPNLPRLLAEQQARGPRRVIHSTPDRSFDRIRSLGITNITTWELSDELTVKNVLGYRHFTERNNVDIDGSALPLLDYVTGPFNFSGSSSNPSTKAYSEELQLQGNLNEGVLKWVLGGYIEHVKPDSSTNVDYVTQLGSPVIIYQGLKDDHSKALFGQFDYDLSSMGAEGLKFTGGLRYTWDKRSQIARLGFRDIPVCFLAQADATCTVFDSAKFHALTYNASLQYQVAPRTLVYLSARKGYKSGGFNSNAITAQDRFFRPETVNDIEIGLKTQFEMGGLEGRFNAAAYRGKFKDIQITRNIVVQNNSVNVTGNIGRGVIQGIELEATLIPAEGLNFSAFYAYTDAHYTRIDYTDPLTGKPIDPDDFPFSNTPEHKLGVSATYSTELGSLGDFSITGSYTYQSKVKFLIPLVPLSQQDPQFGQKGYGLLNMNASLKNVGGMPFDLGVFANNLTNKTYKIFENNLYPDAVGVTGGIFGEPRMCGVQMRYRFGGE